MMEKYFRPVQPPKEPRRHKLDLANHLNKDHDRRKIVSPKSHHKKNHHQKHGHHLQQPLQSDDHDGHGIHSTAEDRHCDNHHHHQHSGGKTDHPRPDHYHHRHKHRHVAEEASHSSVSGTSSSSTSSTSSTLSSSSASSSTSSFSSSSTPSSSSSSSALSSETSTESLNNTSHGKPRHSQSWTDISRDQRASEEEDDRQRLIDNEGYPSKLPAQEKRGRGVSCHHSLPRCMLKKKQQITGGSGKDGGVRKARSMEALSSQRDGEENEDEDELERKKTEARKNLVKEKLKFSAFLNEITRQVLSPLRLTSLGVTDAHRSSSASQVSGRSLSAGSRKRRDRQQSMLAVCADSCSHTTTHSQIGKRSQSCRHSSHSNTGKTTHHSRHHSTGDPPHCMHHSHRSYTDITTSPKTSSSQRRHSWSSLHRSHSPTHQQCGGHHYSSTHEHRGHHSPSYHRGDHGDHLSTRHQHHHGGKHDKPTKHHGDHHKKTLHHHGDHRISIHHRGDHHSSAHHHHGDHHSPNDPPCSDLTHHCHGNNPSSTHHHGHDYSLANHSDVSNVLSSSHTSNLPAHQSPNHGHEDHYKKQLHRHGDHHDTTHHSPAHHHHHGDQNNPTHHHGDHLSPTHHHGVLHSPTHHHHHGDHHSPTNIHLHGDQPSPTHHYGDHKSATHHHHHGDHHSHTHRHADHHSPTHHHGDDHSPVHHHEHGDHYSHSHHHHHEDQQSPSHQHHHGDQHSPTHHHHHEGHHGPINHHRLGDHPHGDHHSLSHHHRHGDQHSPTHHHHHKNHHRPTNHHSHEDHHHGDHHSLSHHHHHGDHHSHTHHHADHHSPTHHHGDDHSPTHHHEHGDHYSPSHHHHHEDHHSPSHQHHHGDDPSPTHHYGDHHSSAHHHHHGDHHSPIHHHGDHHGPTHHHAIHSKNNDPKSKHRGHSDVYHQSGQSDFHLQQHQQESHHHHHTSPKDAHHPSSCADTEHICAPSELHHGHHSSHQKSDHEQPNTHHHSINMETEHFPHSDRHSHLPVRLLLAEKPKSDLNKSDSSRNTTSLSSQDDEQTSCRSSTSSIHKDRAQDQTKITMLQGQNEDLHHSLLQTAVRMECLGEEFMSNHQLLEKELHRTRVELGNITDKFERLQDNYSSTQVTNNLLEQRLYSVAQNMEDERERLNQRITTLTKQLASSKADASMETLNVTSLHNESLEHHFHSDDSINQFVLPITPPPTQFMDSHNYAKAKGQNQSLGSVPEEEESDWSEMGDEIPRFIMIGSNRVRAENRMTQNAGFLPFRHEGRHWVGQGEGDIDSESGGEENVRQRPPPALQTPHLQFAAHRQVLPAPLTDNSHAAFKNLPDGMTGEGGYRVAGGHRLGSPILTRSASLEEIPVAHHHMHEELRGTEAMMDLHHPDGESIEDSDNEIIHHWRTRNESDGAAGRLPDTIESKADSSLASLQSAQRMLNHFICELQPSEGNRQDRADMKDWTGLPDDVLKRDRTQL